MFGHLKVFVRVKDISVISKKIELSSLEQVYTAISKNVVKRKAKPRLQGNMGIFETSLQCRHHIAKIFPVAPDIDERSVRV